jgi:hypothetical protein
MSVIPAPPISIRCVGPQSVTSWPNRRCQTSSSGKPASANAPQAAISTPPTGARQPQPTAIAAGPGASRGIAMASTPGEELAALGAGADVALDVVEQLREHADAVAALFVTLFLDHVWRPFDAAGRPPERWPEVRETLERLRPLAGDAVMAVFGLAMGDAVECAFGAVLQEEDPPGARA